jgi:hypothetical protein
LGWLLLAGSCLAASEPPKLAQDAEALRKQIVELNRELFLLEEDLLHPASTRTSFYLSLDQGSLFTLEGVKIKLDGKPAAAHLYTESEMAALKRGAIQPLLITNLDSGQHNVTAVFTGKGPKGRDFKRAVTVDFEKGADEKAFEIQVRDSQARQQPEFLIKPWK